MINLGIFVAELTFATVTSKFLGLRARHKRSLASSVSLWVSVGRLSQHTDQVPL